MSTPSPAHPNHELKPHWQAPAAAAGAMAAGLMVGRKSAVGLVLGVAAMAGARWLLNRQGRNANAARRGKEPSQQGSGIPAGDEPALAKAMEAFSAASEVMDSPPVMIYEQQGEMPSSSASTEGTVWFALFNEAPQGSGERPDHEEPSSGQMAQIALAKKSEAGVFDGGPLPESFFSEAPAIGGDSQGADTVEEESQCAPMEVLSKAAPEVSHAVMGVPPPGREIVVGGQDSLFMTLPTQVVAKPPMEAAERVPRPASSAPLPHKRASGEPPRAWIVPAAERQLTMQSRKDSGTAPVHRSIVPHEIMSESKSRKSWPLVTAAMVLLLAVVALVVVGTGLDGGLVREWKERWINDRPAAATMDDRDAGLWSREGSKVAALPAVGK